MAKKAKLALTKQQLSSLCYEARELHDYWREWNPDLYNEAAKDGSLYELVSSKGQRMQDEMDELMQQGLNRWEAHHMVWDEIYSSYQIPEPEEKDPVLDFLEQYRQNALTMTDEELDAWMESLPD